VKILVKNIKEADVFRGCIITRKDQCHVAYEIMAKVKILNLPSANPILSPGFSCMIHLHTSMEEVKISKIKAVIKTDENDKKITDKTAKFLTPGQTGIVIIKVSF